MTLWQDQDLFDALGLTAVSSDFTATGISIDTRTLKPGEVFVAIKGENFDGHSFLGDAFAKGASAVIVSQPMPDSLKNGYSYFVVDDTQKALNQLGAYARQKTAAKIIAVTGSVGKTTTKEWLNTVLGKFGETVASHASYNNHLGVPLSLCRLTPSTLYGVLEVGMNHVGEIAPLSELIQPDIAIITTIGEGHIGHLDSLEKIADEKSKIFAGLKKGGIAIIDHDSPYYDFLNTKALESGADHVFSVGETAGSSVRLCDYQWDEAGQYAVIIADLFGIKVKYTLSFSGKHFAMNSLVVLACTMAAGLPIEVSIGSMSELLPLPGRGIQRDISLFNGGTITLVDDSYNANPTSMAAALKAFGAINPKGNGRKIAVLGEMLELGEKASAYHLDLLTPIQDAGIDVIFAAGSGMESLFNAFPENKKGDFGQTAQDLIAPLMTCLKTGDILFVKGSKGSKVYTIVDHLISSQLNVAA
ncbi:MAG: UDP-N-acetylmuramoyl-tripeptide--D-alanyl-D-alanine ligase [Alphaproteobacteria bacterium]|nr:UDP-N-acetylmuramoyl-tripeptide--D-alanyl-D-alanine ligase [Alphaproteobacteria bacterium]